MEYTNLFWYYIFPAIMLNLISNLSQAVEWIQFRGSFDWEQFCDHLFWSLIPGLSIVILAIFICLMFVECVGQIDEKIREFKLRRKG